MTIFKRKNLFMMLFVIASTPVSADTLIARVYGPEHNFLGIVEFSDLQAYPYGLLIKPMLTGLPSSKTLGFHIHEIGNCTPHDMSTMGQTPQASAPPASTAQSDSSQTETSPSSTPQSSSSQATPNIVTSSQAPAPATFMSAGSHYDPNKTGKHRGPSGTGHLGDLPALVVNYSGVADVMLLAPRLNTRMIRGRALMIHAGGDNYSDTPVALGGGGARIGCGVIDYKDNRGGYNR